MALYLHAVPAARSVNSKENISVCFQYICSMPARIRQAGGKERHSGKLASAANHEYHQESAEHFLNWVAELIRACSPLICTRIAESTCSADAPTKPIIGEYRVAGVRNTVRCGIPNPTIANDSDSRLASKSRTL